MELANSFWDFLKSKEKVLYLTENCYNYYLTKIPYSDNIDVLFVTRNFDKDELLYDNLENCGFYDKRNKILYNPSFFLKSNILKIDISNNEYQSLQELQKTFDEKVSQLINNYIYDNVEEFYQSVNDYKSTYSKENVYNFIINDIPKLKYEYIYHSYREDISMLEYIDKGESYLHDIAFEVIEGSKEYIGQRLIDYDKCNELIKLVNKDKNDSIHKKKKIIESLRNKNFEHVRLFVYKDSISFEFDYNASDLESFWNNDYLLNRSISHKDREKLNKFYGKNYEFSYDDIYKIEYDDIPIYEDEKFYSKYLQEDGIIF